ncbi:MAG: M48 family metallopeptidase [Alphaproteobacteria bacterium]|nr:M48 family metallopeptidase [Alphaproteobacteria bacterium]
MMPNGEEIPIEITVRRGSKNIVIRPKFSPARRISVSKPWHASNSSVMEFLERKRSWLENAFAKNEKQEIAVGGKVMILDEEHIVQHPSRARLERFVKQKFLEYAKRRVAEYGGAIEKKPSRITVRDTSSRWGSCSAAGALSFSFRLAFAPEYVARYVIAHEMAHLLHFDHSPRFWADVGRIYGPGWQRAKDWLTKNGQTLHKYL